MTTSLLSANGTFHEFGDLESQYWSMHIKASLGRFHSFLTGRSRNLLDLSSEVSQRKVRGQHYAGIQKVPIKRIKGSEGRSGDFDRDFNPMQTHLMDRWINVALTRFYGDALPAVELIQVGEDYYVRDGHHRISVAHAFGEEYIDAAVIVMEMEPVSAPLPALIKADIPDQ